MTTIQYFPSLREYTKNRGTVIRNRVKKHVADFMYEWKAEDDPSEYFDMKNNEGFYRVNYNMVSYLLINHQELFENAIAAMSPTKVSRGSIGSLGSLGSYASRESRTYMATSSAKGTKGSSRYGVVYRNRHMDDNEEEQKGFLKYIRDNIFTGATEKIVTYDAYMKKHNINIYDFILGQYEIIRLLHTVLAKKLPTCAEVFKISAVGRKRQLEQLEQREQREQREQLEQQEQRELILYRGFNFKRYGKMLGNIKVGEEITTPTFLSTSVQEIVAVKFAYSLDKDAAKQIVWKIIITEDMFSVFNYTFISHPFHIRDTLETLFANGNIECEFLLNIGARLKCVSVREVYFKGYSIGVGYNIHQKKYTEYTFVFLGWNKKYTRRINKGLSNIITVLKKS